MKVAIQTSLTGSDTYSLSAVPAKDIKPNDLVIHESEVWWVLDTDLYDYRQPPILVCYVINVVDEFEDEINLFLNESVLVGTLEVAETPKTMSRCGYGC